MKLRETFAKNVRHWRHVRGLSQEDLAYKAGISRSYMYGVENAQHSIGLDKLERIAEVLAVDPSQLLDRVSRGKGR